MKALRFSLATLLAAFVLVAAGLGMLVNATPLWASITYTVAVLSLLLAVCAAIYRRGAARSFWIGASIFGWCYMGLAVAMVFWPGFGIRTANALLTDDLLTCLHREVSRLDVPHTNGSSRLWYRSDGTVWIDGQEFSARKADQAVRKLIDKNAGAKKLEVYVDEANGQLSDSRNSIQQALILPNVELHQSMPTIPTQQGFLRVGHALFALLFALVGGVVCRILYLTRERKS